MKKEEKPLELDSTASGWRVKGNYYQQYSKAVKIFLSKSKSLTPTMIKELESTIDLYNESLKTFQGSNQALCVKVPSTTQYKLVRESGPALHSAYRDSLLMLLFEDRLRFLHSSGTSVPKSLKMIDNGYTIPKRDPVCKKKQ